MATSVSSEVVQNEIMNTQLHVLLMILRVTMYMYIALQGGREQRTVIDCTQPRLDTEIQHARNAILFSHRINIVL